MMPMMACLPQWCLYRPLSGDGVSDVPCAAMVLVTPPSAFIANCASDAPCVAQVLVTPLLS